MSEQNAQSDRVRRAMNQPPPHSIQPTLATLLSVCVCGETERVKAKQTDIAIISVAVDFR